MNAFKVMLAKYSSLDVAAKAAIWFIACNILLKGISFFTVPLFANILNASEYGRLAIFISFQQIIITFATWEIALSAYQRGLFKFKNDISFFTSATLLFSNIITVIFFLLVLILFHYYNEITGISLYNTALLFVFMMLQPAYSCWIVRMRTDFQYKKMVFATIMYSIIDTGASLWAICYINATADIKFQYSLLATITFFTIFYFRTIDFKLIMDRIKELINYFSYLFSYQLPIVFHALSFLILAQADRIMIEKMVGSAQAGIYSIAYTLGFVIVIIQQAIDQSMIPWRFKQLECQNYWLVNRNTNLILVFFSIFVISSALILPDVLKLLFSDEYFEARWCIPPITISVYFMFLYTLFVWIENYFERTKYVAYVSFTCAIVNIALNYLLIPFGGYIVCAYTTLLSYICFAIGHFVYMKKTCRERYITTSLYDSKFLFLVSFIMCLAMCGIVIIYDNVYLRYAVLFVIVLILYSSRSRFWDVYKNTRL